MAGGVGGAKAQKRDAVVVALALLTGMSTEPQKKEKKKIGLSPPPLRGPELE